MRLPSRPLLAPSPSARHRERTPAKRRSDYHKGLVEGTKARRTRRRLRRTSARTVLSSSQQQQYEPRVVPPVSAAATLELVESDQASIRRMRGGRGAGGRGAGGRGS